MQAQAPAPTPTLAWYLSNPYPHHRSQLSNRSIKCPERDCRVKKLVNCLKAAPAKFSWSKIKFTGTQVNWCNHKEAKKACARVAITI